jgi:hypothetical protein
MQLQMIWRLTIATDLFLLGKTSTPWLRMVFGFSNLRQSQVKHSVINEVCFFAPKYDLNDLCVSYFPDISAS